MRLADRVRAVRETLFPPDPGSLRMLAALRATLAGVVCFALVILLGRATSVPDADRILGFAIGLFTGAAVRDPTRRGQAVTMALVLPVGFAATTAAAFLADIRPAAILAMAAIAFGATYGGQRAPRWGALGLIALISFVIGLVTRLPPATLPIRFAIICLGAGCAALVRLALVPERPQAELRWLRRDIRRELAHAIGAIAAGVAAGGFGAEARLRVRRKLDRLTAVLLMAFARIRAMSPPPRGLGLHLLDLQLAAGRLADIALRDPGTEAERPALVRGLAAIQLALAERRPATLPEMPPTPLGHVLTALAALLERVPPDGPAPAPLPPPAPAAGLRTAAQAAIAVLLAVLIGQFVSSRWYWAAFAAFVTFQGTRSRGESVRKTVQFMCGTVAGVGVGVLVAVLLSGHELASVALIVVAVFCAFDAFQSAYGVMVFWITIILGLVFGLLGFFPPELLLLRLKETAIGAGCGVLVASLVMARPHREVTEGAAAEVLRAIARTALAAGRSLAGPHPDAQLATELLTLESRFLDLEQAAQPQLAGFGAVRRTPLRRRLTVLEACQSWLAEIAAICLHEPCLQTPELARFAKETAAHIEAEVQWLTHAGETRAPSELAPPPAALGPPGDQTEQPAHLGVRLLMRIDLALSHYGKIAD